jgi:hypothetical protein
MKPAAINKAIELIAAVFILLFVYTAVTKLISHKVFLITLNASPILNFAGGFLSWAVPVVELVIVASLFMPRYRSNGFIAAAIMMMLFTIYIGYMLISASKLPCSCGGIIKNLSWRQHLGLNVFLTAMALTAIFLNKRLKFLLQ